MYRLDQWLPKVVDIPHTYVERELKLLCMFIYTEKLGEKLCITNI